SRFDDAPARSALPKRPLHLLGDPDDWLFRHPPRTFRCALIHQPEKSRHRTHHRCDGGGFLHHAGRADRQRRHRVPPARRAEAGGERAQRSRAILPEEPDQPRLHPRRGAYGERAVKRPRREGGGGEVALMAVITKAMGAFLVLVVIMLPDYVYVVQNGKQGASAQQALADASQEAKQLEQALNAADVTPQGLVAMRQKR